MIKSTRHVAIIAILVSTLSGLASAAQGRANTDTTPANLHIRVNVVQVVMTDQNSKVTSGAAISYSIPTAQPRTSVTKEIRSVRSRDGKSLTMVEMTTVVVE